MANPIFNYDDGDFIFNSSGNIALDSDGNMIMLMSDNMAMNMDSGEIHFISDWSDDDE